MKKTDSLRKKIREGVMHWNLCHNLSYTLPQRDTDSLIQIILERVKDRFEEIAQLARNMIYKPSCFCNYTKIAMEINNLCDLDEPEPERWVFPRQCPTCGKAFVEEPEPKEDEELKRKLDIILDNLINAVLENIKNAKGITVEAIFKHIKEQSK